MLPLHPLTSRLSISMRRGLPAHSFRIASDKEVTLSARRVPLNPDQYFSHPCAHPRILHLVHLLFENVGAPLIPSSLSLSLINVSLRSLSVNDKRWKFFYFFLFFSFSRKHDSRTRRPLSGRGKREALLSRPVFLANAPKPEGGKGWKYPLPR